MDRVTFDFEKNTVTLDMNSQHGEEYIADLSERRSAILAAAGYDTVPMSELKEDIKSLFDEPGLENISV